jgi:hypothetical protein
VTERVAGVAARSGLVSAAVSALSDIARPTPAQERVYACLTSIVRCSHCALSWLPWQAPAPAGLMSPVPGSRKASMASSNPPARPSIVLPPESGQLSLPSSSPLPRPTIMRTVSVPPLEPPLTDAEVLSLGAASGALLHVAQLGQLGLLTVEDAAALQGERSFCLA